MINKWLQYSLMLSVAAVFHIFVADYISFWILAFLAALPLVSFVFALLAKNGATAELIIKSSSIQKNEQLPIQLKTYNKHLFMACRVRVKLTIENELLQQKEDRFFLMTAGHAGQTVEQIVSSDYCGMLRCTIAELRIYDTMGLFSFRKNADIRHSVAILPSVYPLMAISSTILQDVENNITSRTMKGNDPSEIMDVREYRDTDRIARIHWKLSDKYDQLMVKDFGDPISNDVLLLLDLIGNSPEETCSLLDAAYSISNFLIKNQLTFEMEWYDSIHERSVLNDISQKNDLKSAFEDIMTNGRCQKQPWVLKSCSRASVQKPYSVVMYLCSEITSNSIDLIYKRLSGSRIYIMLVTDVPTTRPGITTIDIRNMEDSMKNLVI